MQSGILRSFAALRRLRMTGRRMKFPYEKHFLVCTGKSCNKDGDGDKIREHLKDLNKSLGRKKNVRVCAVSCLDLCDDAPNMLVWPEGEVFSHLDTKDAIRVYRKVMGDD